MFKHVNISYIYSSLRDSVAVLPPEGMGCLWYPREEHLRVGREDKWSGGEPELDPAAGSWAAATIQPWRDWGRTLTHTHTHTCLMGECVFVRWVWLEGWEGEKTKFGRDVRRNVERKCSKSAGTFFKSYFKLRSHPWCTSVWMLW